MDLPADLKHNCDGQSTFVPKPCELTLLRSEYVRSDEALLNKSDLKEQPNLDGNTITGDGFWS